jgi:hypothetical protein
MTHVSDEKNESPTEIETVPGAHHVDLIHQSGKVVNFYLILACTAFASASFIFGFDDKIISPVAALEPFVSPSTRCLSTSY